MLQWIRKARTKKRFRIVMIIGIALLSFGLVGSYALWSLPKVSSSRANNSGSVDPSVQYDQLEKRIAEIEKSLSQKKDDPELLEKLGNAYYDLGFQMFTDGTDADKAIENMKTALANYEKALEIAPDNVDVTLQAAYTASIVGDNEKADGLYQKAVSLDEKSVDVKASYGQFLLYAKGDYEAARKQFRAAMGLSKDEAIKQNLQSLLDQADQLEELQKQEVKNQEKDNEKEKEKTED